MTEDQTEEREEQSNDGEEGESQAKKRAKEVAEGREKAQERMTELEKDDEPPTDLSDWPADEGKYITYGGAEGDHSYAEGVEQKLGPSELRRFEDGSVSISGKQVDNPEDHKADPIPGGPTDPNATGGPEKSKERAKSSNDDEGSDDEG